MKNIGRQIWTHQAPLKLLGVHLGTRMTVVKLDGEGLWVHSPCKADEELLAQVEALGPVDWIVAPNVWHHIYVAAWRRRFPEAKLAAPQSLIKKRPDLRIDLELGTAGHEPWPGIESELLGGMPKVMEFVFFHKPSATLIGTDVAFNIRHSDSWVTRMALKLQSGYGGFVQTKLLRSTIKDKAAALASYERILRWPVKQLSVCHGELVTENAHAVLEHAFAWLLPKPSQQRAA